MDYKYIYILGAFVTGIAATLFVVSIVRTPHKETEVVECMPTGQDESDALQKTKSQSIPDKQEIVPYTSHIAGNETRYGGARISNTEITGNLAVHGGLTAYNIKAYASSINGGATITNGLFQDMLTVHGGLTGRNITTDSMKIFGVATIHNTNITAALNVKGGLNAQTLCARAAQIHGGAIIIDGHFAEQLRATGTVTLVDSDTPEIILYAPRITSWLAWLIGSSKVNGPVITMQQSHVQNISVTTGKQDNVCVKIAQKSSVGTIRFIGNPGIVILDESSTVETVVNGTVQAEACK